MALGLCILAGCGGGGGSLNAPSSGPAPAANVTAVTVGPGPNGQVNINIPYVNVTICQPNGSNCVTVNNLLVDTRSYGIRVLASALSSAGLTLTNMADPSNPNNTIAECVPFVDGYTWGPIASATIQISGETASNIPINVLDDNGSYDPSVPTACTALTSNTSLNSVSALHANGVLGIGVFAQDCGADCAECAMVGSGCTVQNDLYYSCTSTSNVCASAPVAQSAQTRNPVTTFAVDNNGVILELPSIPAAGSTSASGSLVFGISTQSNNALGNAAVLTADSNAAFTTVFNGQTFGNSFLDSGSNALFFPDSSISTCASDTQFYCPASTLSLSATNQGSNGTTSSVSFQIADLNALSVRNFAFSDVGGPAATSTGTEMFDNDFDFGLPFFFGRNVFIAVDGATAAGIAGPYYAY
jgi:hypothetical protein